MKAKGFRDMLAKASVNAHRVQNYDSNFNFNLVGVDGLGEANVPGSESHLPPWKREHLLSADRRCSSLFTTVNILMVGMIANVGFGYSVILFIQN